MPPTTVALTLLVCRSFVPATMVLPASEPAPFIAARLTFGMFLRLPPIYASSVSIGPMNGSPVPFHASQMRCARYRADFWLMPSSMCNFRKRFQAKPISRRAIPDPAGLFVYSTTVGSLVSVSIRCHGTKARAPSSTYPHIRTQVG